MAGEFREEGMEPMVQVTIGDGVSTALPVESDHTVLDVQLTQCQTGEPASDGVDNEGLTLVTGGYGDVELVESEVSHGRSDAGTALKTLVAVGTLASLMALKSGPQKYGATYSRQWSAQNYKSRMRRTKW